jgi:GT2 family glycosyltransferase
VQLQPSKDGTAELCVTSPAGQPDVSVVIASFNTREMLRRCLLTLEREAGDVAYEAIVVDNASRDGSADMIGAEFRAVKLIRSAVNLGFAGANNHGFAVARGRYVVMLNSDAFLYPRALRRAVEHMDANPQVGLGGGRLVGADGCWQPSARMFPSPINEIFILSGLAAKYGKSRLFGRGDRTWAEALEPGPTDWVPGAFSVVRRDLLLRLGYLDERFFLYFDEVDLCQRIKAAGYSVWYWPDIVVEHLGGESAKALPNVAMSSSGSQLTLWRMRSQLLYHRKHHGALGAWLTMTVETSWNRLRALRNWRSSSPAQRSKAQEARTSIAMMKQAWRETRGGQSCPPKPW